MVYVIAIVATAILITVLWRETYPAPLALALLIFPSIWATYFMASDPIDTQYLTTIADHWDCGGWRTAFHDTFPFHEVDSSDVLFTIYLTMYCKSPVVNYRLFSFWLNPV